jgi:hypothetical protein
MRSNPTGVTRIEYRINGEDQLERRSWPITATSLNNDGNRLILINNVANVEVEQLSRGKLFTPNWPPLNEIHSMLSLPRMIRITIILLDGTETIRLIPGLDFDPRAGRNNSGSGSSENDYFDDDDSDDEDLDEEEEEPEEDSTNPEDEVEDE